MLFLYQRNIDATVTGNSTPRASGHIGLSVAALLMAGTALAPTQAQVANLGGLTVSRNDFENFKPPGTGITPSEITNGTLRIDPLTPQTFAGDLTNSGGLLSLIKLGTGDLTLAGVNTHSGNTTVQQGRLIAGSLTVFSAASRLSVAGPVAGLATADLNGFNQTVNGLVGNGTGVVTSTAGPALLTINTSTNLTFNGALQGQLGIVKRSTSTQTFTNLNPTAAVTNATGPITLEAGTLRIGSSNALGSGAMTVTGAGTLSVLGVGPLVFDNNIALQAALAASVASGESLTMNGVIDGAGSLIKTGVGLVTITGANSYTGGTSFSGGRVLIGNATALGSGLVTQTQTTVLGLSNSAADLTVVNAFQMNGTSLQVETPNVGVVFTLSGAIGGSPDVNLVGGNGGTVVLSGTNSFPGLVRMRSGTLGISNAAGVNSATAIRAEGGNRAITILAANQVVSTRLISHVGDGALTVTVNTGANNVEFSNALRDGFAGSGDTLAIVKTGTGIFTASNASATGFGSNLVSGGFSVAEGTLNLTGRMSGDITEANGATLAGTGTQSAGTTTIGDGATLSAGDARLTAPSIGTLTLNNLTLGAAASTIFDLGAPSIDTATPINDLIIVSGNLNLGGSTLNFNTLTGFTAGTYRLMTYAGTLLGTATLGVLPLGFNYALSTGGGNIDLNVMLADFYWDGSGPFGNAIVDGGSGTWNAGNTNFTDVGGNVSTAWQNNARAFFTANAGAVTVDGNFTFNTLFFTVDGYVLNSATGASLGANAGTIDVAVASTAAINVDLVGAGGLAKTGDGTLALGGNNGFTGGFAVNSGVVVAGSSTALGADLVSFAGGTTLLNNAVVSIGNDIAISGGVTIDTPFLMALNGSITGNGGLTKAGRNGLELGGNNSFAGGINFTAGQITLNSSTGFGDSANVVAVSAGTFGLVLADGISVANAITLANSTPIAIGGGNTATLSGNISGAGGINLNGGTLVLAGNNSYGSGSAVTGTLQLNNDNAAGSGTITLNGATLAYGANLSLSNAVVLNGGGTVATNNLIGTLSGLVSGDGGLSVTTTAGAPFGGTLVLANAGNSFTGGLTIGTNATVLINSDGALGDAANGVAINESQLIVGGSFANSRAVTLGGSFGQINVATGQTLTLDGIVTGSELRKGSAGTLVLNGANNYTSTQVFQGTLAFGQAASVGSGDITVSGGTTLRFDSGMTLANTINGSGIYSIDTNGHDVVFNGSLSGGGADKLGLGTLTLNNAVNAQPGTLAVFAGRLELQGAVQGSVAIFDTASLVGEGSITGQLFMGNGGTLRHGNSPATLLVGSMILSPTSSLVYDLDVINTVNLSNDLIVVDTDLTLDGMLSVVPGANFNIGTGAYTLFTYGNLLADGGLLLTGLLPPADVAYSILTTTGVGAGAGSVLLSVAYNGQFNWDGNGAPIDGIIQGGPGTWNAANTNWTNSDGLFNLAYVNSFSQVVNFGGVSGGGAVTVDSTHQFGTMNFTAGGYVLSGAGDLATDNGTINVGGDIATVNATISGINGLTKGGAGELVLGGSNGYTGGTNVDLGILTLASDTATGNGLVSLADGTTLRSAGPDSNRSLDNDVAIAGSVTFNVLNDNLLANGSVSGGQLVLNGGGRLVFSLTNDNSYAGGTLVQQGGFQANRSLSLGTGDVTMTGGTYAQFIGDLTVANNFILLAGRQDVSVSSSGNSTTLNGLISGDGGINKQAGGRLVLGNAANSFMGDLRILEGTVASATATALGGGNIVFTSLGGTLETLGSYTTAKTMTLGAAGTINTNANTNRFDGLLSGPSSLTKTGAGTLILNGVNGYTDGTLLNAGTITVGNNSALGTGRLTVANATTLTAGVDGLALANAIAPLGAGTVNTQAFTFTLNGNIGGTGSIAKIGSGNLIMAGNNSYAGGTNLNTGSLTVTNNNSIGTGTLNTTGGTTIIVGTVTGANTAVTLANAVVLGAGTTTVNLQGTSLVFNNDASIVTDGAALTLNGVVSGAGALATGNFGTLTLNGDNSYSGGLLINTRSVVYVGSDTAVGTGTVTTSGATGLYNISGAARTLANAFVLNGGTWMGGTSNMVLNGTITGAGFVIKAGAQTLTLNNANSFTGTSQLRDGRITVGTGTALGTGALTVFAPTVPLAPVAGLATTLAAGTSGLTLANNVTLSTGSNLIVESGTGSFTLAGVISGAGGLTKTQSGNLILNGGNSFSGGTLLNAGRITVGTSTALGTGRLTMAGGTTLASGAADLVLANAITALGAGTIDTAANILTLNGVIDGAGSLAKVGSGTLVLGGDNLYAGGTALNAGTIQVNTNTALGTGGLVMADGTTLLAGLNGLALGNAITLGGTSTVNTQAFTFTLNGVIGGAGTLAKTGTGTLVLNGSNGFTGGTALNSGTIRVGNSLALGTGNLAMAAGTFLQAGAPLLTIANTISMAGGATVDVVGQTLTLGGVISGTGPLSVIDSAANPASDLTLTGVNTYTGGTVVTGTQVRVSQDANLGNAAGSITLNGGTLWTTASFASARAVTLGTGGGTARVAPGTVLTLTGVVGGTALTKIGGGTLALNAANTYAGGTALNAGTLTVGNNSGLGTGVLTMADATTLSAGVTGLTVANNIAVLGAATVNSGASPSVFTLAGVISGAGSVIKQATGILTLTGASTYTGATTVAVGTLNVTGSLVSAVTVNSGAALNGTGTVGALNVLAGGSVNPGAPGTADRATLTVTGAATLNGTYTANIASNDRISAGGALTLGGTLAVVPVVPGGFTQFNTVYTVASGSTRTGTFATTTGLDQFGIAFNPLVEYTATQANIRLAPQSLVTLGNRFGGISGNPLEVALAFDRAVAAGYNPQAFFAVYANAGSNLPRTLREMSGEQRATERRVVLDTNRVFRETALDRLNLGMSSMAGQQVSTSDGDRSLTFWLRGAGSWGKAQTNGAATSFQTEQVGLLTGIDWSRDALTVGGMFHFTTTDVEFGVLGGSSRVETVGGTIYGGYRKDSGLVANGGISVSSARAKGSRAITLAGFSQSLAGRTTGTTYQFFGELAWDLAGSADTRIEPFARMTLVKANMNGLTETGGVAALTAAKQNYDITVTNLGMRFGTNVADGKVALNVSAAWQGTTGDRDAATIIGISAVGQNGNIRSVLIDRSALVLQGGVGVNLSDMIRFNLDYSGLIGKRNDDHGGRATLNFKF